VTFAILSKFPNRNLWLQLGEVSFDLRKAKLKKERNPVLDSPLGPGLMRVKRVFFSESAFIRDHGMDANSTAISLSMYFYFDFEAMNTGPYGQQIKLPEKGNDLYVLLYCGSELYKHCRIMIVQKSV
jgi:hypothetical protein